MWLSLSKKPALVVIVLFVKNKDGYIVSRRARTALVCISGHKQDEIDNTQFVQDMPNDNSGNNWFKNDQFITEAQFTAEASQRREFKDKWESALREIRHWDQEYSRPKQLGYMRESERLGNFAEQKGALIYYMHTTNTIAVCMYDYYDCLNKSKCI